MKTSRVSASSPASWNTESLRSRSASSTWLFAPFLLSASSALTGGFWDDAWHTERGRDSFFIAPHIAIYAGIALTGAALGLWTVGVLRRRGLRTLAAQPALALALLSVGVTLASAPIDNFWHVAFGRDAVIWSPPHMLGIVGTMGLAVAVLVQLQGDRTHRSDVLSALAGALVLAAASFSVVEYETDVPQFPTVWYLPVLATASALALTVVRSAWPQRYAAGLAAVVHLAFMLGVSGFLLAAGFSAPALPLLVVPALALDLAARRRWSPLARAALYVAALFATYVPARSVLGADIVFAPGDVAVGALLAFVAVTVVFAVASAGPRLSPLRAATVSLLILGAFVVGVAPALAHDPGQGKDAGTVAWTATARRRDISAVVRVSRACAATRSGELVARRAGRIIRSRLTVGGCSATGHLRVDADGRWFVYADLERPGGQIESWIPVRVGSGVRVVHDDHRFAYRPNREAAGTTKVVAGAVLYLLAAGLLGAMLALVKRQRTASVDGSRVGSTAVP